MSFGTNPGMLGYANNVFPEYGASDYYGNNANSLSFGCDIPQVTAPCYQPAPPPPPAPLFAPCGPVYVPTPPPCGTPVPPPVSKCAAAMHQSSSSKCGSMLWPILGVIGLALVLWLLIWIFGNTGGAKKPAVLPSQIACAPGPQVAVQPTNAINGTYGVPMSTYANGITTTNRSTNGQAMPQPPPSSQPQFQQQPQPQQTKMAPTNAQKISGGQLSDMKNSGAPFMVMFYKEGCPPCQQTFPKYDQAAANAPVAMYVMESKDAPPSEGINAVPTIRGFNCFSGEKSKDNTLGRSVENIQAFGQSLLSR
jgi:thiol-disulfide isomerase/thioredoxin